MSRFSRDVLVDLRLGKRHQTCASHKIQQIQQLVEGLVTRKIGGRSNRDYEPSYLFHHHWVANFLRRMRHIVTGPGTSGHSRR
jgi:hypothetical protein